MKYQKPVKDFDFVHKLGCNRYSLTDLHSHSAAEISYYTFVI